MADEVLYSSIGDLVAAEVASGEYLKISAAEGSLMQHPALRYLGRAPRGSKVVSASHLGIDGYDTLTATAEGTDATNAALVDGKTQVTIARYALKRQFGDLARMFEATGQIDFARLGASAALDTQATLINLICAIGATFSTGITATSTLTLDDFLDGVNALDAAHGGGQYLAILHPRQWGDLRKDMLTVTGGSAAFDPNSNAVFAARAKGYQGRLFGVDVYTTNKVPTSSGDRKGCILAQDAIAWADAEAPIDDPQNQMAIGGSLLWERSRDGSKALSTWVANAYLGVAMGVSTHGVTLSSDAS